MTAVPAESFRGLVQIMEIPSEPGVFVVGKEGSPARSGSRGREDINYSYLCKQ